MHIPYPIQNSPFTIVEPMRIADFLDLQYQAAESLTETNKKINELLDENMVMDLKQSVENIKDLTAQATSTLSKAELLIDESRKEHNIISDPKFKPTMFQTANSLNNLANQLSPIIGSVDAQKFANDLNITMSNIAEISNSVNRLSNDEKLKKNLMTTVDNINRALCNVSTTLEVVNSTNDKANIKQVMEDTATTVSNLRKFSEKLNKRFLLFRLLF